MAGEWSCRKCRTRVGGLSHLRFATGTVKGSSALCLSCVDKLMAQYQVSTVHAMTARYIEDSKDDKTTIRELQDRIKYLEKIINTTDPGTPNLRNQAEQRRNL